MQNKIGDPRTRHILNGICTPTMISNLHYAIGSRDPRAQLLHLQDSKEVVLVVHNF